MFHHVTDDMTDTESSDCKSLSPCLKGWCEREVSLVEELEGGERMSKSSVGQYVVSEIISNVNSHLCCHWWTSPSYYF